MTKNLIAFGCSLTYGEGLADCHVPPNLPGPKPSSLAWPARLASITGRNCVNQGYSGAGNFQIALSVLSYQFKADDSCFILWSYSDRDMILHDNMSLERLGPWSYNKRWKAWNMVNPDQTKSIKFWYHVATINSWLMTHKIPCYNLSVGLDFFKGTKPAWAENIKFLSANIHHYREITPLALDRLHPGPQAHEAFAHDIAQEIGWI